MSRFLTSFLLASFLISPLSVFAQEIPTENQGTIAEPVDAPYQSILVYLFASQSGDILGIVPITQNLAVGCVGHIATSTEAESLQQPPSDPICSLYRLTTASTTSTDYIRTYAYSPTGNITNKSDQGSYSYQGDQGASYANPHAVTDINGTTYAYDKNGNVLTDSIWTYGWNYNNTLASSTNGVITVTYGYDHNKQRVSYDNGTTTIAYANKYFNQSTATTTRHLFAGNQLVATIEGTGTATSTNYIHTDHLGGTHIVTDESGNKVQLLDYYPFGDLRLNETDSLDEQRKFTGHEYDDDTDLTYANARYYPADTARFLSQDPVAAYIPETFLIDPQQLNMYTYARNNPLIIIDSTGLFNEKTGEIEAGDTLSAITVQINQANSTDYSVSDLARMNNILNPDKIYAGDFIGPTPGVPDITEDLTSTMESNAKNLRSKISPFYFRDKVQDGGDWDLKNTEQFSSDTYSHGFIFRGERIRGDAPGNIHYGYVGDAAYWSTPSLLHHYAGKNQIESGRSNPEWVQNYGGDDPVDYRNIDYGIQLYRSR